LKPGPRLGPTRPQAAAIKLTSLSQEPDQDPFAKSIIGLQAKEAEAFAAEAVGDTDGAVAKLQEAAAIEDTINDLSQPPYPAIPANELCGNLLLELNRPADAVTYFQRTLTRTPGRPKAIFGLGRAAQALGDDETAAKRYQEFLSIWNTADPGLTELVQAKEFLAAQRK
jgi:tetratricopeptide (TPR) repeat protein